MRFCLTVLFCASLLHTFKCEATIIWRENVRGEFGALVLHQPEPAGTSGSNYIFVCRANIANFVVGPTRYVPGSLYIYNNNKLYCNIADGDIVRQGFIFQMLVVPRAATSWRSFDGRIRNPIVGGNLANGEEVYVCRGTRDSTLKVGYLHNNKCYGDEGVDVVELENAEYLAQNLFGLMVDTMNQNS